ncbi:hypothetical protein IU501_14740 [Nocardia otitidiscaviarum]|uniref:hypothetical protein n=1 Tax=Nocardia otitidiscaviarum TaxID=1823 RepID=UPI0011DE292F|nr:hypothetical protein [Nocardia otitidiscaviarum]MBF6134251.1 hypothetical protein [Nocardia otitidiscaviarum]MBF6484086.1 hypothetical protein [Nocardia otitidiscaviarum]
MNKYRGALGGLFIGAALAASVALSSSASADAPVPQETIPAGTPINCDPTNFNFLTCLLSGSASGSAKLPVAAH